VSPIAGTGAFAIVRLLDSAKSRHARPGLDQEHRGVDFREGLNKKTNMAERSVTQNAN
jgi:hypothetical protein